MTTAQDIEKHEDKEPFVRLIICVCASVAILYVSIGHLLKLPLPFFIDPDKGYTQWFALFQAVLSAVVIGVNYKVFARGFMSAVRRSPDIYALLALCAGVLFIYSLVLTVLDFCGINARANAMSLQFDSAAAILTIAALSDLLRAKYKTNYGGGIELAQKISGICVPAVAAAALITFVIWLLIDGAFVPEHSIYYAVSVFGASCPCALTLATIVAVAVSAAKAAPQGVLIKNTDKLQAIKELNCVLLDKSAIADDSGVKEGSREAIILLKERGIRVAMLASDGEAAAKSVAKSVGIDDYVAQSDIDDKVRIVQNMQSIGGVVAVVSASIADLPALEQADAGIALCNDACEEAEGADVAIVKGDLRALDAAIDLSRAAVKNVKLNLFFALLFNVLLTPIAAGALSAVGFAYHPLIAVACMTLSSAVVVCNSMRLLAYKGKKS